MLKKQTFSFWLIAIPSVRQSASTTDSSLRHLDVLNDSDFQEILASYCHASDVANWKPLSIVRYNSVIANRGIIKTKGFFIYARRELPTDEWSLLSRSFASHSSLFAHPCLHTCKRMVLNTCVCVCTKIQLKSVKFVWFYCLACRREYPNWKIDLVLKPREM